MVVVTHRPPPEGWHPDAPFHFVDGIEAAMAKAQELAGDRIVEVAAGDVGGQMLAAGLVDEVRMDVAPVVFGSGKRYFGSVHAQHLLEDPDVVIQGNRVLHLRYQVRRGPKRRQAWDVPVPLPTAEPSRSTSETTSSCASRCTTSDLVWKRLAERWVPVPFVAPMSPRGSACPNSSNKVVMACAS